MGLRYVGGTSATGTGATYTVNLSGTLTGGIASSPSPGDIIIFVSSFAGTVSSSPSAVGNASGPYTNFQLYAYLNDTYDTNFITGYKVQGATVDTSLTINRVSSTAYGGGTVVQVWRGQHATTPINQNYAYVGVTNGSKATPPSATPTVDGSLIISFGAGTATAAGGTPHTAPVQLINGGISINADGSTADISVWSAWKFGQNGVTQGISAAGGGFTSTATSGAAHTIVLAPADYTPNRYWVGGTGTWIPTSGTNWSETSGGSGGYSPPTTSENAIFNQASTYTVTMSGALACKDYTVSAGAVTFATGTTPTLSINGNLSLTAGTTTWNSTGDITFAGTTQTVNTNGTTISANATTPSGTLQLLSNFALSPTNTFTLTSGTLNLNNFTLSTGLFSSNNSNIRSIDFGTTGKINLTSTTTSTIWNTTTTTNFSYTGTSRIDTTGGGSGITQTITTGTMTESQSLRWLLQNALGTITFSANSVVNDLIILTGAGFTLTNTALTLYGSFTWTSGVTISGGTNAWTFAASATVETFGTGSGAFIPDFPIIKTGGGTFRPSILTMAAGRTLTINQGTLDLSSYTLTVPGGIISATGDIHIKCGTNANGKLNANWTQNSGTVTLDTDIFTDSNNTYTLTAGTLILNDKSFYVGLFSSSNSNVRSINFGTSGQLILTSSGTTTTWNTSTTTNFSYSGTSKVLSAGGGSGTTKTITAGAMTEAQSLNWYLVNNNLTSVTFTGSAANFIVDGDFTLNNSALTIYGNYTYKSGFLNQGTSAWTFNGTTTSTIDTAGTTHDFPIIKSGTGTLQLSGALTLGSARTFTLTQGTLDLNDYILTTGLFSSSNSNTRSIAFGNIGQIALISYTTSTIWDTTTLTGWSTTGTSKVVATGGGATTKTINTGAMSEAQALNWYIQSLSGTVSFTASNIVKNLVINGAFTLSNIAITIYGNYTYTSGTLAAGTNTWTFAATSGTQTINGSGYTHDFPITKTGAGTLQLSGALSLGATRTFTLTAGTLDLNNKQFYVNLLLNGGSYINPLIVSNTWTVGGITQLSGTFTLTSNITCIYEGGSGYTLTAGTLNLNNFTLSTKTFSSNNSNTRSINFGTSGQIILTAQVTSTIWNTGTLTGWSTTGNSNIIMTGGGTSQTFTINTGTMTEAQSLNFDLQTTAGTVTFTASNAFKNLVINGAFTLSNIGITIYGNYTYTAGTLSASTNTWTFAATSGTQTINGGVATHDFPITKTGAGTLQLTGNVILGATRTFTLTAGTLDLNNYTLNTTAVITITTSVNIGNGIITGPFTHNGGTINLIGNLTATGSAYNFTFTSGTLNLNNYKLTVGSFISTSSATRTLNFGTSGQIELTASPSTTTFIFDTYNFTGPWFAYTGSATVIVSGGGAGQKKIRPVSYAAGMDWIIQHTQGDFNWDTTNSQTTAKNVTINTPGTVSGGFYLTGNYTHIAGTSTASPYFQNQSNSTVTTNGNILPGMLKEGAGTLTLTDALTIPTTGQFTLYSGTLNLNNYTLSCGTLRADNSGYNTAVRGIDFGNTGQVTLTSSAATTLFAVTAWNGSSYDAFNWTVTGNSKFVVTGGGATTKTIEPGNTGTRSISQAANWFILSSAGNVSISGVVKDLTINADASCTVNNSTLSLYGNYTYTSGILAAGTNTWTFAATSGTQTLTSNGLTHDFPITKTGAGTLQLLDVLTLGSTRTFTSTEGTLNLNNYTLSTGLFSSNNSNTRSIAFGTTGQITLTSTVTSTIWDTGTPTNFSYTGTSKIVTAGAAGVTRTVNTGTMTEAQALSWDLQNTAGTITFIASNAVKHLTINGTFTLTNIAITIYGNYTYTAGTLAAGTNTWTFAATSGTQTINGSGYTHDFPITKTGAGTLQLTSALTLGSTRTFTLSGGLDLNGYTLTATTGLTTTGGSIGNGTLTGPFTQSSGTLTLLNNLTIPSTYTYTLTSGSLVLNNYTLSTGIFSSSNSSTRSIDFSTNGQITLTCNTASQIWDTSTTTNFSYTGTSKIVSVGGVAGTQTINIGSATTEAQALNWYLQNTTGTTVDFTASASVKDLILNGAFTLTNTILYIYGNYTRTAGTLTVGTNTWTFGATSGTQTINGGVATHDFPITKTGAGTLQLLDVLTLGSTRTFTLTQGTLNLNNYTLSTGLFSSDNSTTRSIVFGTTGQITITADTSSTIWNTATTTNFSYTGTSKVVTTGGGATTKTINTGAMSEAQALSWDLQNTAGTITFIASNAVKHLTINGTFTLTNIAITIYGNYTYTTATALTAGTNAWTFGATSGTQTLTSNGLTHDFPITKTGAGTLQLSGALTLVSTRTFTLSGGILDLNNYTLSIGLFSSDNSNTRSILFGTTGQIILSGTGTIWSCATATNLSYAGTPKVIATNTTSSARTIDNGSFANNLTNALNFQFGNGSTGTGFFITDQTSTSLTMRGEFINFDLTGLTTTFGSATRTIYENFIIPSAGGTLTGGADITTITVPSGTRQLNSNGRTLDFPITKTGAGTLQLTSALTLGSTRTFTYTGSFDLNGYTLTAVTGISVDGTTNIGNGVLIGPITQTGGTVTLINNLNLSSVYTYTLTAGTLDLNNYTLSTGLFSSSNSNVRSIVFGTTGQITLTSSTASTIWNTATLTNWSTTGTSKIVTTGTANGQIINTGTMTEAQALNWYLQYTSGTNISFTNSNAFKDLIINGTFGISTHTISITIYGNCILNSCTLNNGNGTTWTFGATSGIQELTTNGISIVPHLSKTGNGTLQLNDDITIIAPGYNHYFNLIQGKLDLNNHTINVGQFTSNYTNMREIDFRSQGKINLMTSGFGAAWLCSDTTGLSYTGTPVILASTSNGGAPAGKNIDNGSSVATKAAALNFQFGDFVNGSGQSGFFVTNQECTFLQLSGSFNNFDLTGLTTVLSNTSKTIYGNWTIPSSGGTINAGSSTLTLNIDSGITKQISNGHESNIQRFSCPFIKDGSGTLQLSGAWTTGIYGFTLTQGTLDLNDYTFTTPSFSTSNSNTRTIAFGSIGQVTLTGSGTIWYVLTGTNFGYTGNSKMVVTDTSAAQKTFNWPNAGMTENQAMNWYLLCSGSTYTGNRDYFKNVYMNGNFNYVPFVAPFIYGDLTIDNVTSMAPGSTTASNKFFTFASSLRNQTIYDNNNKLPSSVHLKKTGQTDFHLNKPLVIANFELDEGNLCLNNHTLTTEAFSLSSSNFKSINFGNTGEIIITTSSTWTPTYEANFSNVTNFSYKGTSKITVTGTDLKTLNLSTAINESQALNWYFESSSTYAFSSGYFICKNLNITAGSLNNTTMKVYENFTIGGTATLTTGTNILTLDGTNSTKTQTITTNGITINWPIIKSGANTLKLNDALTLQSSRSFTMTGGTLDFNNYTLTAAAGFNTQTSMCYLNNSGGNTINLLAPITVGTASGGSGIVLNADLTSLNDLTLSSAVLDLNNHTLTAKTFTSTATQARSIAFGDTGKIELVNNVTSTIFNMSSISLFTYTGTSKIVVKSVGGTQTVSPGTPNESQSMNFYLESTSGGVTLAGNTNFKDVIINGSFTTITSGNLYLYGNLKYISGPLLSSAGVFYIIGSGTQTIDMNGNLLNVPITKNGSGTLKLVSDLNISNVVAGNTSRTLTLTNGTIDLNGKTLTTGTFVTDPGTKNITFNGGTLIISGSGSAFSNGNPTGFTTTSGPRGPGIIKFTSGSASTIVCGGSVFLCTLDKAGAGALTISTGTTAPTTFYNLTNSYSSTGASSITFTSGATYYFHNWNASGESSRLLTLNASSTTAYILSKISSRRVSANYLTINRSTATGDGSWYAGTNSTLGTVPVTGWTFTAPPAEDQQSKNFMAMLI